MQGSRSRASVPVMAMLVLALGLSGAAAGQFTLPVLFGANNGQAGNMFDVVASNAITLKSFDLNLDGGTFDIEIWSVITDPTAMNPGSIIQTPTAGPSMGLRADTDMMQWNLEATVLGVVSNGFNNPTPLGPGVVNIPYAAGETKGIYITVVAATAINYTNGNNWGAPYASNGDLAVLEGFGKVYQFGASFGNVLGGANSSRRWNGNIHYDNPNFMPGIGQAPQTGLAVLDINNSAEVNGLPVGAIDPSTMSPVNGPYFTDISQGTSISFHLEGTPGQPIILLAGPLLPAALVVPPQGQIDIGNGMFDPVSGFPLGIVLAANGTAPTFPDAFFVLDVNGEMDISLPVFSTFPLGILSTFQAVVFTGGPSVVAISNAVQVNIVP